MAAAVSASRSEDDVAEADHLEAGIGVEVRGVVLAALAQPDDEDSVSAHRSLLASTEGHRLQDLTVSIT